MMFGWILGIILAIIIGFGVFIIFAEIENDAVFAIIPLCLAVLITCVITFNCNLYCSKLLVIGLSMLFFIIVAVIFALLCHFLDDYDTIIGVVCFLVSIGLTVGYISFYVSFFKSSSIQYKQVYSIALNEKEEKFIAERNQKAKIKAEEEQERKKIREEEEKVRAEQEKEKNRIKEERAIEKGKISMEKEKLKLEREKVKAEQEKEQQRLEKQKYDEEKKIQKQVQSDKRAENIRIFWENNKIKIYIAFLIIIVLLIFILVMLKIRQRIKDKKYRDWWWRCARSIFEKNGNTDLSDLLDADFQHDYKVHGINGKKVKLLLNKYSPEEMEAFAYSPEEMQTAMHKIEQEKQVEQQKQNEVSKKAQIKQIQEDRKKRDEADARDDIETRLNNALSGLSGQITQLQDSVLNNQKLDLIALNMVVSYLEDIKKNKSDMDELHRDKLNRCQRDFDALCKDTKLDSESLKTKVGNIKDLFKSI